MLGQVAYLVAKTESGELARITGRVIEAKADTAVVATRPDDALYHVLMYGLTFVPTVLRTASCFVSISGYPEFFHMQVVQT